MKRALVTGVVLAVMATQAAPAAAQRYELGVSAGGTYGTLSGGYFGTDANRDWTWGGMIGGYGDIVLHENTRVHIELNYTQKGGIGRSATTSLVTTFELGYLELPLLLQVRGNAGNFSAGAYVGATLGFNISCKVTEAGSTETSCTESSAITEAETFELSAPLGVIVGYNLGKVVLYVDGRYSLGLSTIPERPTAEFKSRTWMLMARVGFPIM
jgi:opacity protein-like surface antigen